MGHFGKRVFEAMDTDNDGIVSKEEGTHAIKTSSVVMTRHGDGTLLADMLEGEEETFAERHDEYSFCSTFARVPLQTNKQTV